MTTKVDYNDGNWWGWNGGDCPVHPKTLVRAQTVEGSDCAFYELEAYLLGWDTDRGHPAAIVAFRVIEEYKEPREFWIRPDECCFGLDYCEDTDGSFKEMGYIHVKEVLNNDH